MMNLATPSLWYPGQSEAEWQEELVAMMERSRMTDAFLKGKIAADTFLDYLAENDIDPLEAAEEWEECLQPGTFSS